MVGASGVNAWLEVLRTAVSNNSGKDGAGLCLYPSNGGTVQAIVSYSTISGNHATNRGGAIFVRPSARLELNNVTIANNSAQTAGGGIFNDGGTVQLYQTLLDANTAGDPARPENYAQGGGTVTSRGYNASSDGTLATLLTAAGDRHSVPLLLGPLQDNGGPTWTHLPRVGSPALDSGDPAVTSATDQRGLGLADADEDGVPRADRGAVEFQPRLGTLWVRQQAGVLSITGRYLPTHLTVREDGAGAFVLTGRDGTHLDTGSGAPVADQDVRYTGVTSIVLDVGSATPPDADVVTFVGSTQPNTRLPGDLVVQSRGALTLDLSGGFNVDGQLRVSHDGPDAVNLTIAGAGTSVGSLLVFDGDGDHTTAVRDGATLRGYASLNDRGGTNTATFTDASLGSFVSFVGTGDETLTITRTNVATTVATRFGGGTDALTLDQVGLDGNLLHYGSGTQTIRVLGSTVAGYVSINAGDAVGPVLVEVRDSTLLRILSVVTGSGDDVVTLVNVHTANNTAIVSGGGADRVDADDYQSFGSLLLDQGAGDDTANLQLVTATPARTEVRGAFSYAGSDGNDAVRLGAATASRFRVLGASRLDGGPGTDVLDRAFADLLVEPAVVGF